MNNSEGAGSEFVGHKNGHEWSADFERIVSRKREYENVKYSSHSLSYR